MQVLQLTVISLKSSLLAWIQWCLTLYFSHKFYIAAVPFSHTGLKQRKQKQYQSFRGFAHFLVILSKPFDVTMAFTCTCLQRELYIRYSFQGNRGISLLTFHWGAFTKSSSYFTLTDVLWGLVLSKVRKFLGKGSRVQDDPQAGCGVPQGRVLWSSTGVMGAGARGHLLVGQVEWLLLSPDKPLLTASMKQSARFHHYWPVCWVTDFIKNFNFLNALCNQTGLSPICINAEEKEHLVLQITHGSGYNIRRYTRGTHYCNQIKNILGQLLPMVML